MLPYLSLFGAKIPMYTLMVLLGAVAYVITTVVVFEYREGLDKRITNRVLLISIPGFASLVFFAFIFNSLFHSIEKGQIVFGGITWLGGVVGAFPLMVWMLHKFLPEAKGNALHYFSLLIPGIVIAHAFGRLGCFFGGCCYGRVTNSVFGVVFPEGSLAAQQYPGANGESLPVLPTQLFEAVFELLLYVVLLVFHKKTKKYNIEIYLFSYGIFRFILEFFRGDDRGASGLMLSPSQIMSLLIIAAGILILLYKKGIIFKGFAEKMRKLQENPTPKHPSNVFDDLRELDALRKDGIITEEEFERVKEDLLKKITA